MKEKIEQKLNDVFKCALGLAKSDCSSIVKHTPLERLRFIHNDEAHKAKRYELTIELADDLIDLEDKITQSLKIAEGVALCQVRHPDELLANVINKRTCCNLLSFDDITRYENIKRGIRSLLDNNNIDMTDEEYKHGKKLSVNLIISPKNWHKVKSFVQKLYWQHPELNINIIDNPGIDKGTMLITLDDEPNFTYYVKSNAELKIIEEEKVFAHTYLYAKLLPNDIKKMLLLHTF